MKNHGDESKGLVTCVRLSKETRNRLAEGGTKDQTFDDIINELIDEHHESSSDVKNPVIAGESGENSL